VGDITLILQKIEQCEPDGVAELMRMVYGELRQLAAAKMARESSAHTLQPTALVHEAWLRLGGDGQTAWRNRRHFFGAAAEAMRQILIDRSRRRGAARHGGDLARANANALDFVSVEAANDQVVAVSAALERLAQHDAGKAELVKLRYFVGLTIEEAARAMEISEPTAKRWWAFARAWLAREIERQNDPMGAVVAKKMR
jgi:RNA polymerase sigma factor (TIGR02999 family)